MTEIWEVFICWFESYLAQFHSRCGDANKLTPKFSRVHAQIRFRVTHT